MPLARYASQFSQLAETGLIGVLSGHVPVSFAPALVDALLAAPVLIAQVQLNGPHALDPASRLAGTGGRFDVGWGQKCRLAKVCSMRPRPWI
jgi:hypothetical protein